MFHASNTFRETKGFVASATVPYLAALLKSVRSSPNAQMDLVDKVLKIWAEKQYFSDEDFAQFKGDHMKQSPMTSKMKETERKPLVKPGMLGVNGDPHWLLPVSCMLEAMVLPSHLPPLTQGQSEQLQIYSVT